MSGHREKWRGQFSTGLEQMGLDITSGQQEKMLDYLGLLMKWNRTYNLTAIRNPDQAVAHQLLDSLSILPLVRGRRILDVGTGAGLPGIPLAICMPDVGFTLIDSNGKKTRFVQQARMELGLNNLEVIQIRVEQLRPELRFDTITTRAFAALPKMVELVRHLLSDNGRIVAMKGIVPVEEVNALQKAGAEVEVVELNPPLSGERHAIILSLSASGQPIA